MSQFPEILKTRLQTLEIGPYGFALPGPMKLHLELDGEIVSDAQVEMGYLHRGVEYAMEHLPWGSAVVYADRLDPEASIFGEMAYCLAVENLMGYEVSFRVNCLRIIFCELVRVSNHLLSFSHLCRSIGLTSPIHYFLRDREKILDLFELLSGSRFMPNFLRMGGLKLEVTEGFLDRVIETTHLMDLRIKDYQILLAENSAFRKRLSHVGQVHQDVVGNFGLTGPVARASGQDFDARKNLPYSSYEQFDFDTIVGAGVVGVEGDAFARFDVRLREIGQSLHLIRQAVDRLPAAKVQDRIALDEIGRVPVGEAFSRVESPRGMLTCQVVSDGGKGPVVVRFGTPSRALVQSISAILPRTRVEDIPVILASLFFSIAEADK